MLTSANFQQLWDLIHPIKVGMLVTNNEGSLEARPMHLVQKEWQGSLYFYTKKSAFKVQELQKDPSVCLSFSCPKLETYVSISGEASLNQDRILIEKFWSPFIAAWFPEGKDDPEVALIEVKPYAAQYWNATSNTVVQLFQYAKALITGQQPDMGDNQKLS